MVIDFLQKYALTLTLTLTLSKQKDNISDTAASLTHYFSPHSRADAKDKITMLLIIDFLLFRFSSTLSPPAVKTQ
jgi:hypothetical protein